MSLTRGRLTLGGAGLLLAAYGAVRLLTDVPFLDVVVLAGWLVGVVALHDGVLSPLVLLVGAGLTRLPPRARGVVQGALVVAAPITVIGVVLVLRQGSQPPAKALLLRDYQANLAVLLGLVAAGAVLVYAGRLVRDRRLPDRTSEGDG